MVRPKRLGDMVTTTVSLEREDYKRLRHRAVEAETNVRELIREAVSEYLRKAKGRKGR